MLQVSPPDAEWLRVSLRRLGRLHARRRCGQRPLVIAEINPRHASKPAATPRIRGVQHRLSFRRRRRPSAGSCRGRTAETKRRLASPRTSPVLIDDGAVLQVGIGSLPDLVLTKLGHFSKRHLGIHSGTWTHAIPSADRNVGSRQFDQEETEVGERDHHGRGNPGLLSFPARQQRHRIPPLFVDA